MSYGCERRACSHKPHKRNENEQNSFFVWILLEGSLVDMFLLSEKGSERWSAHVIKHTIKKRIQNRLRSASTLYVHLTFFLLVSQQEEIPLEGESYTKPHKRNVRIRRSSTFCNAVHSRGSDVAVSLSLWRFVRNDARIPAGRQRYCTMPHVLVDHKSTV